MTLRGRTIGSGAVSSTGDADSAACAAAGWSGAAGPPSVGSLSGAGATRTRGPATALAARTVGARPPRWARRASMSAVLSPTGVGSAARSLAAWRATAAAARSGPIRPSPTPRIRSSARCGKPQPLFELAIERREESFAEHRRDDTGDHDVGAVGHRRERGAAAGGHDAGALDDRVRGASELSAGRLLDRLRTGVRIQAAGGPAAADGAAGLDDQMAELAEVAREPLHQSPVRHERAVDVVAEHERHEVLLRRGPGGHLAAPHLGERHRPAGGVDRRGQIGGGGELAPQREVVPDRHADRLHRPGHAVDRARAGQTDRVRFDVARVGGEHATDQPGHGRPHVAGGRGDAVAHHDIAVGVEHPGRQTRRSEVDRQIATPHRPHGTRSSPDGPRCEPRAGPMRSRCSRRAVETRTAAENGRAARRGSQASLRRASSPPVRAVRQRLPFVP